MRVIKEDVILESRGDTSLRKCLEIIAKDIFNIDISGKRYSLHHKDGNHDNNNIDNLVLMERGRHTSFHAKLRCRGFSEESEEGIKLFSEYKDSCIDIGYMIRKIFDEYATSMSNSDDRKDS